MYICLCKGITESKVQELGRSGFITPEKLASELGINKEDCCGRCIRDIEFILMLARNEKVSGLTSSTQMVASH